MPSALHVRKFSMDSDIGRSEAIRFCEFANSDKEEDDWVQESTCYRNRLTVEDTLKIENNIRKLVREVEDEVLEEEDEEDILGGD